MPLIKVNVKWSGKKYEVEVDTDEPTIVFKTQLYTMTGVEPDRQKILIKGLTLKDETNLNNLNLNEGTKIMLMGTAGELPKAPEKKTQFVETMTDRQLAEVLKLPAGLTNLGNTCYLNSTLQCLGAMPELQSALNNYSGGTSGMDTQGNLTASLRDLYRQLNRTTDGCTPVDFLQILRSAFPQFAQRDNRGYLQQDAKECWTEIVSSLNAKLKLLIDQDGTSSSAESFVTRFMTGEFTTTLKCLEAPDEPPVVTKEPFTELDCHINISINYMQNGIVETLETQIEKTSPTLERSARYTKTQKISRLPAYLTVQFVRFFWKSQEQVRAKILRKVKFPLDLDVTEFCTEELKKKVEPVRTKLLEFEKERNEAKNKAKLALNPGHKKELEEIDPKVIEEIQKLVDPELSKDVGANVTGLYELCGVVTHKGRTADSGHYIGWVRKDDPDRWIKYDDDKVSAVSEEDVQKLDGGGDWHTAYILLYRSKKIA